MQSLWIGVHLVVYLSAINIVRSTVVKKPNIIFFIPDEMRASSAYDEVETPNLDRLASEGVKFTQCHTTHTVCSQSRSAFMTGWPTHVSGHRSLWSLLRSYEPQLLRYLHDADYEVLWFGKNDNMDNISIAESTETMDLGSGPTWGENPYELGDPRYYSMLWTALNTTVNGTQDFARLDMALKFLENRKTADQHDVEKKPFFLFLPLSYPHPPYSCPDPFYSQVDPDDVEIHRPVSTDTDQKPDYVASIRTYTGMDRLNESEADILYRNIRSVYLGCIAYSDYLLGLLLDTLDATEQAENTAVFFFSDHGDYAGDYGLIEKWPSGLEDALTHVPLVIRAPFLSGAAKGTVVDDLVQLYDIVPTTLDLANIEVKHVHFAQSLMSALTHNVTAPRSEVFSEGGYSTHEPRDSEGYVYGLPDVTNDYYYKSSLQQDLPLTVCRAVSVRTKTHKLIVRSDPLDMEHDSELYDLVADPYELVNRYNNASYADVQAFLKNKILFWLIQTSDVTPYSMCDRSSGDCEPEPW